MAYTDNLLFHNFLGPLMNPGLAQLQPYPFEKLAGLKQGISPPPDKTAIDLSIGEPRHKTPGFILDELRAHLPETAIYPKTRGSEALRKAMADWLRKRFTLPVATLHPDRHILPVNGTREALFALAQCVVDTRAPDPVVMLPNPFYQIYEGAALLAGARPVYVNCVEAHGYIPDFKSIPESVWQHCQLLYLCTPGNPTGAVIGRDTFGRLLELADRHDFIIACDECYSEIYLDESNPPPGLLQVAAELGRDDYRRCVVFHSLSKRSNVPGLRSGFVAGDERIIGAFLNYRTYHGCAMPPYVQAASTRAWQDEAHVIENRNLYREKFTAVLDILAPVMRVSLPAAGFYLWPETPVADCDFARGLYATQNVTVLPGSFLSRSANGINPGANRVRMALVPPLAECREAALRINAYILTTQTGKQK